MILAIAVIGAIAVGLVRGASLRSLAGLPFSWGGGAILAFLLQIVILYFPEPRSAGLFSPRVGLLVLSYAILFAVVWQNRHLPGIWVIALGLLSNLGVMLLNGGYMPITQEALAQARQTFKLQAAGPGARILGSKDILLPRAETSAWWLSDVFVLAFPPPVPTILCSVFSPGDVMIGIGASWLILCTMKKTPREIASPVHIIQAEEQNGV